MRAVVFRACVGRSDYTEDYIVLRQGEAICGGVLNNEKLARFVCVELRDSDQSLCCFEVLQVQFVNWIWKFAIFFVHVASAFERAGFSSRQVVIYFLKIYAFKLGANHKILESEDGNYHAGR